MGAGAPLAGKRVLVTRPGAQASDLVAALEELGADVACVGLLRVAPLPDPEPACRALRQAAGYDFVIVTSANAAVHLADAARRGGVDLAAALAAAGEVIASGPATAAALEQAGCERVAVPGEFSAAGVAGMLGERARGARVLLPRAEEALAWLPDWLRAEGAVVDEVALYRTEVDEDAVPRLREELARGVDVVAFASPSAVAAFVAGAGAAAAARTVVACIGPTTAAGARAAGLEPAVTASVHTSAGLAAAIGDYFR